MGGIGKTILAQTLADDRVIRDAYPDGVIWFTIGRERRPADLVDQVKDTAKLLGIPLEDYDDPETYLSRFRACLRDKAALLILDDIWDARQVNHFRANAPRCRLLFTTRDASVAQPWASSLTTWNS